MLYAQGADRKQQSLEEKEAQAGAVAEFRAYGKPLEKVTSFKYLGRLLTVTDDDWPVVIVNLKIVWRVWSRL